MGTCFGRVGSLYSRARADVPGQQFRYPVHRVVGSPLEYVTEVCLRGQPVQFGGTDQAADRRGAFIAGIGFGEQIILPPQRYGAQLPVGSILIDFQPAGLGRKANGYAVTWVCREGYDFLSTTKSSTPPRMTIADVLEGLASARTIYRKAISAPESHTRLIFARGPALLPEGRAWS